MTAQPAPLSAEFASALREEHARLITRVSELRDRAERLRGLAEQADAIAVQEERNLREIEGLLGLSPQLRIESLSQRLRGLRLREVAVEVLAQQIHPGAPIHYTEWFDLLIAAGHRIGGKDPLATFLAQVSKAQEVERVAPRSGLYRLRSAA